MLAIPVVAVSLASASSIATPPHRRDAGSVAMAVPSTIAARESMYILRALGDISFLDVRDTAMAVRETAKAVHDNAKTAVRDTAIVAKAIAAVRAGVSELDHLRLLRALDDICFLDLCLQQPGVLPQSAASMTTLLTLRGGRRPHAVRSGKMMATGEVAGDTWLEREERRARIHEQCEDMARKQRQPTARASGVVLSSPVLMRSAMRVRGGYSRAGYYPKLEREAAIHKWAQRVAALIAGVAC